jgi:hypothetical protein
MIRIMPALAIVALFAVEAGAEVTRVDVAGRAGVGTSGCEKIVGTIHFAIGPNDPPTRSSSGSTRRPNSRRHYFGLSWRKLY